MKKLLPGFLCACHLMACTNREGTKEGQTEITNWQDGKKAAVPITYDDGFMKQFTVAKDSTQRPIKGKVTN